MRALVLGHQGMLGHMVAMYLRNMAVKVTILDQRWPLCANEIREYQGDYIINCIGAIPQKTNQFSINYTLPMWLDTHADCKIIHPGTDCEMDEDAYGSSKHRAAQWIESEGQKTKILKTSIIGPELHSSTSLLEWFLAQQEEVYGYTEAMWNGNTTLEWSKHCLKLMKNWDKYHVVNILEGERISKYEMLKLLKEVYEKQIKIMPKKCGSDKCLKGEIKTLPLKKQLLELKGFSLSSKPNAGLETEWPPR